MTFDTAFLDILKAAREKNLLAPVDDHGWQFRFTHIWNTFVANKDVPAWMEAELEDTILNIVRADLVGKDDAVRTARLKAVLEKIKGGNVYSPLSMANDDSALSRERFGVRLVNWKPEFYRISAPDVPLELPDLQPVQTASITFPTGELIIVDWPRIKGFNDLVAQPDISLNYAHDRVKRTKRGIETHNLVEIAVGNTCPGIYKTPTGLQFGNPKWDDETDDEIPTTLEDIGSVTTDYWAVTIIDKADLFAILERNGIAPQPAYDAWLESNWVREEPILQVEPATWHITWMEDSMARDDKYYLEDYLQTFGTMETVIKMDKAS